jgi:DNA-binding transcriptional LysR family regulator
MTATAHAIVAGAIALKFPDPIVASALAFTSHFVMDAVPHWDIGTNWRSRAKRATGLLALAETGLGITVAYGLFAGKVATLPLLVAIFAALLPDWLETPWYIFYAHQKKRQPAGQAGFWEKFAYAVYRVENVFHAKANFPEGVMTQVVTVLFFVILLR